MLQLGTAAAKPPPRNHQRSEPLAGLRISCIAAGWKHRLQVGDVD